MYIIYIISLAFLIHKNLVNVLYFVSESLDIYLLLKIKININIIII